MTLPRQNTPPQKQTIGRPGP